MPRVAFITDQHISTRWEEALRIMAWCEEKFAECRPDVIALGGDLFDRAPSVEEVRVVGAWLVRLAETAPVVGVMGNHDPAGMNVFNLLSGRNPIHVASFPELYRVAGIEFALLPWPRKGQLLAQLGDVAKEEARQVGVELLLNVLRGLGQSEGDEPRCFVGHVQLRGAKVSTGQPLAPGADFELGLDDLALANCDAYLLGHVHMPSDDEVNGAPVSYGGSFRRTVYGEVEEKSVVVLDFDGHDVKRSRIPIPCAPMFLATDEWDGERQCFVHGWDGLPFTADGSVADCGLDQSALRGAEIRLRFQVDPEHRGVARAHAESVRDQLLKLGAADVKLDPQVRPKNRARAPEIAKAKTLTDKIQGLWKAQNRVPDPTTAKRLLGKVTEIQKRKESA